MVRDGSGSLSDRELRFNRLLEEFSSFRALGRFLVLKFKIIGRSSLNAIACSRDNDMHLNFVPLKTVKFR